MTGKKHEHSLRNKEVGEAYMLMLSTRERCLGQGLSGEDMLKAIEQANPWGPGQQWPSRAWHIALREFRKDFGLLDQ